MPVTGSGDTKEQRIALTQRWRPVIALAFLVLLLIAMVWILNGKLDPGWDFRINLWTPASLLVRGQSPYDVSILHENVLAVWLPMVIGALFPVGWLDIEIASNLWFVTSLMALMGTVILATGHKRPTLYKLLLTTLSVALFPSTIAHFRIGQFTILATFIFLIVAIYKQKLSLLVITLLLAFSLAKPQLGTLIVSGMLVVIYLQNGQRQAIKFIGLLLVWAVALTFPLFIGYSGWLTDFWQSMANLPKNWYQPSLFTLLPHWTGGIGYFLWGILALAIFGLNGLLWNRLKPADAIFWSLALTPLVTPYIWSWDFVMILPLFAKATFYCRRKRGFFLLGGGYVLTWYLMYQINTSGDFSNHLFWWVPWFLFGVIVAARSLEVERQNIFESLLAFDVD